MERDLKAPNSPGGTAANTASVAVLMVRNALTTGGGAASVWKAVANFSLTGHVVNCLY